MPTNLRRWANGYEIEKNGKNWILFKTKGYKIRKMAKIQRNITRILIRIFNILL